MKPKRANKPAVTRASPAPRAARTLAQKDLTVPLADLGPASGVNLMAGLKFTLLGTELTAGIEKNETEVHIFVYQDVASPNEGITIDKLIEDVKTLMGKGSAPVPGLSPEDIKSKLSVAADPATFKPGAMRIVLRTVYLDIHKRNSGESTVEYAFRLDVKADGLIPVDVKLVKITAITLAVWNTTNEKVKQQLALSIDSVK